jgi:ATP-dependent helicase HepA
MLERARVEGAEQSARRADLALVEADALLDAELRRIEALARVNPAVRLDEIARVRDERDRLRELIPQTRPRLDALRLVASPDFLSLRKS